MTDQTRPPKGGGNERAPKRKRGRNWLLKRSRAGKSWQERKMRSRRYCAPQPVRSF